MIVGLLVEADEALIRGEVPTVAHDGSPWVLARRPLAGVFGGVFGSWRDFEFMPSGPVPTIAHAHSPVLVAWSTHNAAVPHIYERELYEAWLYRVDDAWFRVMGP